MTNTRWWRRAVSRTAPVALVLGGLSGLHTTPAYAAAPVAGAQTSGDPMFPNVGNGGYDALHYDVDLAWGSTGVVNNFMTGAFTEARSTMTARTTGAPLASFGLDFEGLTIDAITVDGEPATWERVVDPATIKYKLVVTPATPVDGEFTTVVTYHGVPVRHIDADGSSEGWVPTRDGATFLGQPVGSMTVYPHNNTPADKATYTFSVEAPSQVTSVTGTGPVAVAGNGELLSRTPSDDGSTTTWVWDQQEQMASELAMLSIGKYDVLESDITLASGRTLPEWTFVDSSLSEAAKASVATQRARITSIIDGLETVYGPYPGNSTGIVVDDTSGINYALETQDRSFFPGSVSANTLVHEFAHQWFGNNVAPTVWPEIWIAEGMASWAPTYFNAEIAKTSATPAETAFFNAWNTKAPTSGDWLAPPATETDSADLYNTFQSYTRPSWMYEALRTIMREDYVTFLKTWQSRYGGTSRTGAEFMALAEEISGYDLDAFFQDWLYDTDKPAWPGRYDVSIAATPAMGTVPRGTAMDFTVSAANTGKVALTDGVVTVDVTTLGDDGTLGTLPDGVVRTGNTLTWTVPTTEVGATATTSIPFTTTAPSGNQTAAFETVYATAAPASPGGACGSCGALESAPKPTITGTPTVGVPLTATTTGWPAGSTFAYQWSVGGVAVEGATAASYMPVGADLAKTVTVAVTGTAPGFAPTRRVSNASVAVAAGTLTASPVPTLSGTPKVDVPVTAVPGAWDTGTTFTYQWRVANVDVATTESYTPVVADAGKAITVAVTGTKAGYAPVTRTSVAVNVAAGTPTLTPTPVLSGAPVVGKPVTVVPGTWDAGTTLAYRWSVGGQVLEGVRGDTYTPRPVDLGKPLTVTVTGTRTGYAAVSRSTEAVTIGGGSIELTSAAVVTGTPAVGSTLVAETGPWDEGVVFSYQWLVEGEPSGTGPSRVLTAADLGREVSVDVTGSKPGYTPLTQTSAAVRVVAGTLTATPVPTVTGTPRFGTTLTATTGPWDAGVTLATQWLRDGTPIAGATGTSYALGVDDLGARISARVTGTKAGYTAVTRTSADTAAVARAVLPSGKVLAKGAARVGKALTAAVKGFGSGTTVSYTWYAGSTKVGTGRTLRLGTALAGKKVTVRATVSKAGHETATVRSRAVTVKPAK
jgi:hypothetical protein